MNDYAKAAPPDPLAGQYVGFWKRFFAACIDMALYSPLYWGIEENMGYGSMSAEMIFTAIALFSYAFFFSSKWQASPGMRLMGFHVSDEHGARISYGRALWWGVVSTVGVAVCCAGVFYMQYRQSSSSCRAVRWKISVWKTA
jgi:uncharacterized RDD family membrane protein YckC